MNIDKRPIYTFDTETDPFVHGLLVKPFAAGLYTGEEYYDTWGTNCIDKLRAILERLPEGLIYAHNFGKFDFYHCKEWFVNNKLKVINGRVVEAVMGYGEYNSHKKTWSKHHVFRDSYAIFPYGLAQFDKDDIDYNKFFKAVREQHKPEIRKYLKKDCTSLWALVTDFVSRFGTKMTIGSAAISELMKFHEFENADKNTDKEIRSQFYFGGRVQCFEKGALEGNFKVYDVNSMYPDVMRNFKHPISKGIGWRDNRISKHTAFLTVTGASEGAFPMRLKSGSLDFPKEFGTFNVTIHEYKAALDCGLFKPHKIESTLNYSEWGHFRQFIDEFSRLKLEAEDAGDKRGRLFYKLISNSAYGKFSQDPSKYKNYRLTDASEVVHGWIPESIEGDNGEYVIWSQDSAQDRRFNVATAASITGAARAVLMRAIKGSTRPIYCDTDSLICEDIGDAPQHATKLGAWKLEASGDKAHIAAKKLYALFDGAECVKYACKGVKISPEQIAGLTRGEEVTYVQSSPTYKLNGKHTFLKRTVRMQ